MFTFICLVILPLVHTFVLDGQASKQNNGDALLLMLAEEKQLRMQLANQVQALEKRLGSVESFQSDCGCGSRSTGSPAIMAALSKNLLRCSIDQPIVFDSVKLNAGSAYNNIHGIFTAPITGTYSFSATLSTFPQYTYHAAFVKTNVTNKIGFLYADPVSVWIQQSTTVLTHLDAREEVWMVCLSDSRIDGDNNNGWDGAAAYFSHFSGFLVSAD